jgi:hypothetical protein
MLMPPAELIVLLSRFSAADALMPASGQNS